MPRLFRALALLAALGVAPRAAANPEQQAPPVCPAVPAPPPPFTDVEPCLTSSPPGGVSLVRGGLRTTRFEIGRMEQWLPVLVAFEGAAANAIPWVVSGTTLYEPTTSPQLMFLPLSMALFAIPVEFSARGTGEAAERGVAVRSGGRLLIIGESMAGAYSAYSLTYAMPIHLAGERRVSEAGAYVALWTAGSNAWFTGMMRSRKRGGNATPEVILGMLVSGGLAVGSAKLLDPAARTEDLVSAALYGSTFGIVFPLVHL